MSQDEYKPLRIEDLPRNLQPREILRCVGSRHSSDDTLLSIILRVGVPGANVVETSRRLLAAFGSLDQLANASYEEIVAKKIPGIGETKALQIVAAIEFGRRCSYTELVKQNDQSRYISSSEDVYNILMPLIYGSRQELFYVILLGPRNKIIGNPIEIAKGQRDEVALQPNLIFEMALKEAAKTIIVAHNHPSGDPMPSDGDVEMTKKLIAAGELLNIPVLDHMIIGTPTVDHSGFFSMAASGLVKV
ncbi:MAG: DNA repair protein RadC [Kiritimatiellae bacterium]|nr:DNA repair protein RadC [Kiritimatiellia bacterium]